MADAEIDPRVDRVFEASDEHDADAVADAFRSDGTYHEVPRGETFTRSEFRDYLADELFATFPDYRVLDRQILTTAEWATTVRWTFRGTHEGDAGWFEPTGNTVTLPVVSVVTVAEDGISSWRDFFDGQALGDQLGVD